MHLSRDPNSASATGVIGNILFSPIISPQGVIEGFNWNEPAQFVDGNPKQGDPVENKAGDELSIGVPSIRVISGDPEVVL
jgi:hypothetical protein